MAQVSALRSSQYKATQSTNEYSKAGLAITAGSQILCKCDIKLSSRFTVYYEVFYIFSVKNTHIAL